MKKGNIKYKLIKMRSTSTIVFFLIVIVFTSCENKSSINSVDNPSNSTYIPGEYKISNKNNNTIVDSSGFISNIGSQIKYASPKSYTLTEIWDEAEDLRFDAASVLNNARSLGCDSAIEAAEDAINYSDDCTSTRNYSEAESYLDDVQSELNNAQSLLDDCESSENNDGEDEQ